MPKRRIWIRRLVVGCMLLFLLSCLGVSAFVFANRQRVENFVTTIGMVFDAPQYANLTSAENVLDYLIDNPNSFGLVAYSVDVEGNPDLGQPHIFHNADEPFVLASTAKIIVLTAYARAVAAGDLDSAETIPVAEWDRYHLPNVNGGAHVSALHNLGIDTDSYGAAIDGSERVTVDQLAHAMIRFSDNAAPEWFIDRLGYAAIQAVIDDLGLSSQLQLLPHSGLLLALQNPAQPELTAAQIDALAALPRAQFEALVWEAQQRYLTDAEWRTAVRDFYVSGAAIRNPRLEMRAMAVLPTTGSARDYATVMAGVVSERLFSAEVSQLMQTYLDWPMAFEANVSRFHTIGSKGGSLLGVMTGATYIEPLTGDFARQPRIVVLFMNDVPFAAWASLNNTFAHQQLEFEIATSASFAERVRAALD